MPTDDVSDLKDVYDAIDRLCETMRTSHYEDAETFEESSTCEVASPRYVECSEELASPSEVVVRTVVALPGSPPDRDDADTIPSDTEPANPASEMYYTASSEVSLLSDEAVERHSEEEARPERQQCAMAGHVAAMRERFESMTRSGTPCPDVPATVTP